MAGNPPYRKLARMAPRLGKRSRTLSTVTRTPMGCSFMPGSRCCAWRQARIHHSPLDAVRPVLPEPPPDDRGRTHLEELSLLAERKNVFPQVLQGTMILVFRKPSAGEPPAASRPVRTGIIRTAAELGNGGPVHVIAETAQVARRLNGTTIWFVSDRERTYSLLDKILGRHPLLGGPAIACPAKTGPIVWNRVKPHLRPRAPMGHSPRLGHDVGRFRFELATAELHGRVSRRDAEDPRSRHRGDQSPRAARHGGRTGPAHHREPDWFPGPAPHFVEIT